MAAGEPAPFLAQYFELVSKKMDDVIPTDTEALMEMAQKGPDGQEELKKKLEDALAEEAKPLLEKSFDHHDTKRTGVLDKEEAAVFFTHLVDKVGPFTEKLMKDMLQIGIKCALSMISAMLEGAAPEQKAEVEAQVRGQVQPALDMLQGLMNEMVAEYKENKVERDAEAFKVVDSNGDGTLQKDEFLAVMMPGADKEKNKAFNKALGFDEERVQQKMKEQMEPAPGA